MMIKKIIVFTNLFVLLVIGQAFSQMRPLTFSEKIENASAIFEGKVIRKACFWNVQHTRIYTSNTIEVYKVFKGDITSSNVEIITEGGEIDYQIHTSSHELELKEGSVGVFMTEPSTVTNPQIKENIIPVFRVYGGTQGFIKYDLLEKTASDPFQKYISIQDQVYKVITDKMGQEYRVIKSFSVDDQSGTNSKKERCRWKCCKKKNKKVKSQ